MPPTFARGLSRAGTLGLAHAVILGVGLLARPACAADADPPSAPSTARRALQVGASLVPGLVVHGAGQAAAGQWQTGLGLFEMEVGSLGVAAAGALSFWFSGASRQLVGTATAFTLVGLSGVAISFLADLYGALAPPGAAGEAETTRPRLEASMGYRYVYDPRFAYRSLAGTALDLRWRALGLSASAWAALGSSNQRLRAVASYRLLGPRPERAAQDGSFLDLEAGVTHHAFGAEGFALTLGEASVQGRLDLQRIGPSLAGAFAEFGLGWALGETSYAHAPSDAAALLLMRSAFGVYFGAPGRPRGEASVFYDHRHDDYAAGLLMRGVVSGVFGHYGVSGVGYLTDQWGFAAEVQAGSAALVGLSVRYRAPAGEAR